MTEKKIETLFHEAVIIGDQLASNLKEFEKSNRSVNKIYENMEQLTQKIEHISLYSHL